MSRSAEEMISEAVRISDLYLMSENYRTAALDLCLRAVMFEEDMLSRLNPTVNMVLSEKLNKNVVKKSTNKKLASNDTLKASL